MQIAKTECSNSVRFIAKNACVCVFVPVGYVSILKENM